jgi:small subunit ribosomal protein S8
MLNDLISDSLTRIRNAAERRVEHTQLLFSKSVEAIVKIFQAKSYIESYNVVADGNKKFIKVILKYNDKGYTVINEIERISKPGRRVYRKSADIKRFKNGYGTIVLSTSKGVIDNDQAHSLGVGGEVLCTIW